jgi:hypothetical protein
MASRMVNLANHIKTNQLDINEALELLRRKAKFTAIRLWRCTNGRRNGFSTTARAKTANATSTTRAAVSLRLPAFSVRNVTHQSRKLAVLRFRA